MLTTSEMKKLGHWLPRPIPEGKERKCDNYDYDAEKECGKPATIAVETGDWCDACARSMFGVADVLEDRRVEAHYQIVAGTGKPASESCDCVHCAYARKEET